MKKIRLLVRIAVVAATVSFALPSFALDAAYWLCDDAEWGDFGVAENWAIGEAESGVHAVPTDTNFIKWNKSMKFDLGGGSYTVGGLSDKPGESGVGDRYTFIASITNGTLTINGAVYNTLRTEVFNGGKVVFNTTNARSWGEYNGFYVTVHGGGTLEERKSLTYQKYFVTIEEGGTYYFAPTSYGPHPSANVMDTVDNSGTFYAPNGIKRNYGWESTPSSPCPGTYFRQHKGVFKLGGPVVRGTQPYQPLVFEFNGGTLEATNDVSFTLSAIDSAKFTEGSAMTVQVDPNSSLDLKNVTYADDATITKTGPGRLILRDVAVPSLAVSEGIVEVRSDSVAPTTVSFAADTTLRFTVSGFRLDAVTAYDGMAFELDSSVVVAGAGVLYSSDADFLAYAKDAIAAVLPDGFGTAIVGEAIKLTKTSDYMFDASKSSDLSDPTAWKGGIVPVGEDVIVGGAGTVAFTADVPAFKSISVQADATLAVTGGTEEAPVDLPKLTLNYDARLLIATDAVARMTNEFTTVGDAQTLPVLEVATNALLIAQTPNAPLVKSAQDKWSYHGNNLGVTWKNLALRWYGTIRMFHSDVADKQQHCHLYLGYAAEKETSYIAVDCQGGTYHAAGEGNAAGRCMTGLIVAVPDNDTTDSKDQGGKVVPVGTLRFRDYTFRHQPSVSQNPSFASPGLFIGTCSTWYTGNPASIEYDVVFEGDTVVQTKGILRIGGGAHVTVRGPAKWRYDRTAWNDKNGPFRHLDLRDKATLSVEDGAELDLCAIDSTNNGLLLGNSTLNDVAFTIRNSTMSLFGWSGSGNDSAVVESSLLRIGVIRSPDTLKYQTDVFAGLGSVELAGSGLTVSAANIWTAAYDSAQWNRLMTIEPPLTGTGGLAVSNELSGAAAAYSMTVVVTNGANTATGAARVLPTATGAPARLLFADGANWAGTVVADANVGLTNLVDGAAPAEVTFGALQFKDEFPIRVWKTDCAIVANDKVNILSPLAGAARFRLVAMDEPLAVGDSIDLGLYPENAALPKDLKRLGFSTKPSGVEGFVRLVATSRKPGFILMIGGSASGNAPAERTVPISDTEVVIAPDAPKSVVFAANELTNFLSQAAGAEVPLLRAPGSSGHRIYLGANDWARAAGVSVDGIACDGYGILAKDGDVYIAGTDDPTIDPAARIKSPSWGAHKFDHGTLNGVYAFLEDAAGVRFYFPGELGTCVAKTGVLKVRDGWRVSEPDMTVRTWSQYSDGEWFEGDDPAQAINPIKTVNLFRQRASTREYGCCHGLNGFRYVDRFGESHPEYFALDANGNRMIYGEGWKSGHLCWSSGIREEIFQDCLSYCRGEDASVRGIPGPYADKSWGKKFDWGTNVSSLYIDLMPQDGNAECHCERCQAMMRPVGQPARMTEIIWGLLAEVAARLKAEGYEPTFTMMSYADYADLPNLDLPDNLRVMVAKTGPWANTMEGNIEADVVYLARWEERLGRKTWMWTYPNRNDLNRLDIADVPAWAPRAWARYYQGVAPRVFGLFAESETDRAIDNLMGYYLLSRIGWNRSVDTRAILEEFYVRMFGAAAADMKAALEFVEDKFTLEVAGAMRETALGPESDIPTEYRLWTEIYSESAMARLAGYFDAAAAKTVPGSVKERRVALFRRWMYEMPKAAGDAYRAKIDVPSALAYRAEHESENLVDTTSWRYGTADRDVHVYSDESRRMTTTAEQESASYWNLNAKLVSGATLERGATYRLSWFVKADLAPIQKGGGTTMRVSMKDSAGRKVTFTFPEMLNYLSGQIDWIHQSVEFTVPADFASDVEADNFSVNPFVRYAVGSAWYDGVFLEKVSEDLADN